MNPQNREDIKIGQEVEVVLKADQRTGTPTRGIVAEILTNSDFHPCLPAGRRTGLKCVWKTGK